MLSEEQHNANSNQLLQSQGAQDKNLDRGGRRHQQTTGLRTTGLQRSALRRGGNRHNTRYTATLPMRTGAFQPATLPLHAATLAWGFCHFTWTRLNSLARIVMGDPFNLQRHQEFTQKMRKECNFSIDLFGIR